MNALSPQTRAEPSPTATRHMAMLNAIAERAHRLAELAADQAEINFAHPDPEPAATRPPDPVTAFARLSRVLTATVALHARLEAGAPIPSTQYEEDARRPFLRDAVNEVTANHPEIPLRRIQEAFEARLAKDPNGYLLMSIVLNDILTDLGLPPNPQLSPALQNLFDQLDGTIPREVWPPLLC